MPYTFSKLELLNYIGDINFEAVNIIDRTKVLSAGLAAFLARKAPLPSTNVVNMREYFEQNIGPDIRETVGGFNEISVVCTDLVEELCLKLYLLRAEAVFCTLDMPLMGCENFDDRFFNLKFFLSEEDQKFLNANSVHIALVARRLGMLVPVEPDTSKSDPAAL